MEKPTINVLDKKINEIGGCRFFSIQVDPSAKVYEYQIDMINNNVMTGIVGFQSIRKDDAMLFNYDISDKITLRNYLKDKPTTMTEFTKVLLSIMDNILQCHNFLLNENCIFISQDYIFINRATRELGLIYLPIELQNDLSIEFRKFVLELIISTVILEPNSDDFLKLILEKSRPEVFNFAAFKQMLEKRLQMPEDERNLSKDKNVPESTDTVSTKNKPAQIVCSGKSNGFFMQNNTIQRTIFAILVQIPILVSLFLLKPENVIELIKKDFIAALSILAIIGIIEIIAMKKIFSGHENSKNVNLYSERKKAGDQPKTKIPKKLIDSSHQPLIRIERVEKTNLNETVILSPQNIFPYIQGTKGSDNKKYFISKSIAIIGRKEDEVDICLDRATIGKKHAQIRKDGLVHYLKDLNSKNGTFLNGKKIEANHEMELKTNDIIIFSDQEYVFINC